MFRAKIHCFQSSADRKLKWTMPETFHVFGIELKLILLGHLRFVGDEAMDTMMLFCSIVTET